MKHPKPKLTLKRARELLSYAKATGVFRWKKRPHPRANVEPGQIAGCRNEQLGYLIITIDRSNYYAHRLAWFMVKGEWPSYQIDHEDTDGFNNRWRNLRPATHSQQQRNRGVRATNKHGKLKWTRFHRGKFQAVVSLHFGTFDTELEAHRVAAAKVKLLHGRFFNDGRTRAQ